ncbi:MAG: 50S ribosomal protein L10, partial [Rickettsiales bacterium]|nr:50S ribosomal protein L10 [Rickettsiales bacterium]
NTSFLGPSNEAANRTLRFEHEDRGDKGLSVSEISSLRTQIKESKSKFRVAKNTLARRAFKDTNFEIVEKLLVGPTSLAYSDDPVSTSKVMVNFAKENDNLKILGGAMGSQELSVDEIRKLASLPSMENLRAKILGLLTSQQNKIVNALQAKQSELVRLLTTKYKS